MYVHVTCNRNTENKELALTAVSQAGHDRSHSWLLTAPLAERTVLQLSAQGYQTTRYHKSPPVQSYTPIHISSPFLQPSFRLPFHLLSVLAHQIESG
jgi:hypothetical protein